MLKKALMSAALAAGMLSFMPAPASAETLTWYVTSNERYIVHLQFFSQTYNRVWPGGDTVWVIDDYDRHTYRLNCTPGEKICFGAGLDGDYSTYWGVSLDNNESCSNCCNTCGYGPLNTVLND